MSCLNFYFDAHIVHFDDHIYEIALRLYLNYDATKSIKIMSLNI